MAVIKAKKVEFEVLKQNMNGAAAKYMMTLSYEPEGLESKEILNIVLCDETPYISLGEETERYVRLIQRTGPTVGKHPDDGELLSPEDLFIDVKEDQFDSKKN
jgi:hypothetical protein